jgi:hypothetical protein
MTTLIFTILFVLVPVKVFLIPMILIGYVIWRKEKHD